MSPTARALRTLELLTGRPGLTATELGQRLGVTERAARRYVEILREAGIPVESLRGPHGGYKLGRGTRLPPVVFTQVEAFGLVMAVLDGSSSLGPASPSAASPSAASPSAASPSADDLVGAALDKVIRALPEGVGRQATMLRAHLAAAPDPTATRPDPATISALVTAVAAHRRVIVTYRSESGRSWESEVDPWAVVVRFGRWYLVCHSHQAGAVRTYRVDRVVGVVETMIGFTPPPDLDPVAALEANLGTGWEFPTRVIFLAPFAEVAPWIRPAMGRLAAHADGCELVGSTSNPPMYANEYLAAIPFPFRVEAGPELRSAVAALAARFAAAL